jgi:hypothetical protein
LAAPPAPSPGWEKNGPPEKIHTEIDCDFFGISKRVTQKARVPKGQQKYVDSQTTVEVAVTERDASWRAKIAHIETFPCQNRSYFSQGSGVENMSV